MPLQLYWGGPGERAATVVALFAGSDERGMPGDARFTGQYASGDDGSGTIVVSLANIVAL